MSLESPELHYPEDYGDENNLEHQENAKKQFMIIYRNCLDLLNTNLNNLKGLKDGYQYKNDTWHGDKRLIIIPDALMTSFLLSLKRAVSSGTLGLIASLQSRLIKTHLLLEEGYDFSDFGDNVDAMLDVINEYSISEENKPKILDNSEEALCTGGIKPPHRDMITAKRYFGDLLMEKLEVELVKNDTKVRVKTTEHWGDEYDLHIQDGGIVANKLEGSNSDVDKKVNEFPEVTKILAEGNLKGLFTRELLKHYSQ